MHVDVCDALDALTLDLDETPPSWRCVLCDAELLPYLLHAPSRLQPELPAVPRRLIRGRGTVRRRGSSRRLSRGDRVAPILGALLYGTTSVVVAAAVVACLARGQTAGPGVGAVFTRAWTIDYTAHNGRKRHATLLLPSWYGPARNPLIPLVISPHGRGRDGRKNATYWGDLPARHGFAVLNPDGMGRSLGNYSYGYRGQIDDLARMPALAARALPWLRFDRSRIYALGSSMGGQETLLLIARYPRLLAGAAALDSVTDLGRRYAKLLTAPCGASCRQRYGSRYGRLLQRALRREVGGTPAIAPAAYAARSPQSLAGRIASSSVPLQLWWSDADEIVSDPHAQSARLFRTLNRLNRCAPLVAYVGRWAHSKEMHADALLPVALAHFGLVPAEEAAALLASWPSVARLPASGASGCAKTTYSASKESPALNRRLGMRKRGRSKRAWLRQIEQIYATRYRDFLRVAHAEIGDAAVARLVVHEAFVGVVRDGDRSLRSSPPETRLWGAVLRAAAAARPHPPLLVLPNNPSAVRLARVRTATAALPALERHALYLRRFGKLTNATMAVVLGLEPDDVDRVVAAAHRSLAEAFENDREEVCHERQAV